MVEDKDVEETGEEEEDFAAMLEQSLSGTVKLEPGQKIEATILKIAQEWVFLDVGQKGEGVLDRKELLDGEGNITVAEGDRISAYFLSRAGGEMRFTTKLGGGAAGSAQLEDAWRSGIPVEGVIEKEVKGGFEVKVAGSRAFCPYSLVGWRRIESADEVIDKRLPFKIIQYEEGGRSIVVSHRALLEEEREKQRETLKETLKEGMIVRGTINTIQKFGAFVDIGGIEGLLPISEIAWGRVEDIHERLHVGQELDVAVKSLEWEENRFSFSVRETLANPWATAVTKYPAGSVHIGKVSRLAPFGAFVTLDEGVDGLVHISKLGQGKRISHPREVLKEGQSLQVQIEKVDTEEKRISLVLAGGEDAEAGAELLAEFAAKPSASMGTFAELLKAGADKKKKKKKK